MFELTDVALAAILDMRSDKALVRAQAWVEPIQRACDEFEINTRDRMSMFLATVMVETGRLQWLREIWGPTDAQRRYDTRVDLGNRPGDGYPFRGGGLIHATGRSMYEWLTNHLGVDLVAHPEWITRPDIAARSGAAIWALEMHLNPIADEGTDLAFLDVCCRVNTGRPLDRSTGRPRVMPNGLDERRRFRALALKALPQTPQEGI